MAAHGTACRNEWIGVHLQPPANVLKEPEKGNTLITVWRKKARRSSENWPAVTTSSDIQFVDDQDGGGLNERLAGVIWIIFPDFEFTEISDGHLKKFILGLYSGRR
jgi:hypothetical protein